MTEQPVVCPHCGRALLGLESELRKYRVENERLRRLLADQHRLSALVAHKDGELFHVATCRWAAPIPKTSRMEFATREGALQAFPQFNSDTIRTGFFEPDAFARLLAALPDSLAPVAQFALLTGWRRQEILDLTWDRVDWNAGMIRLEPGTTKNDQGREFPFLALPELARLMQARHAAQDGVFVFHRAGKRI